MPEIKINGLQVSVQEAPNEQNKSAPVHRLLDICLSAFWLSLWVVHSR